MQMLQSLGDLSHTISHWCAVAGGHPRNGDFISSGSSDGLRENEKVIVMNVSVRSCFYVLFS